MVQQALQEADEVTVGHAEVEASVRHPGGDVQQAADTASGAQEVQSEGKDVGSQAQRWSQVSRRISSRSQIPTT